MDIGTVSVITTTIKTGIEIIEKIKTLYGKKDYSNAETELLLLEKELHKLDRENFELEKRTLSIERENFNLKQELEQLKVLNASKTIIKRGTGAHYEKQSDGTWSEPLCSKCYQDDGKTISLNKQPIARARISHICPKCQNKVSYPEPPQE